MMTFEQHFAAALAQSHKRTPQNGETVCRTASGHWCSLCHAREYGYDEECRAKNEALGTFWRDIDAGFPLDPLLPSPLGRGYRTVSKRRVFESRTGITLGLIAPAGTSRTPSVDVLACAIEPARHAAIYEFLTAYLNRPHVRALSDVLTYVIIKGSYTEFAVTFNVRAITPALIKSTNTLSKAFTRADATIVGIFLYVDSSGGGYYMGNTEGRTASRKVFGRSDIALRIANRVFTYDILSFSQINHAQTESLVATVRTLLSPAKEATLFDLYSGYGLFGLSMADAVKRVVGLELSPSSHAAAVRNSERQHAANTRFIRADISAESVAKYLANAQPADSVILDPPRAGTAEGVIETIARRGLRDAVHLFCNIETVSTEIARWKTSGYQPLRAVPVDMFPGTDTVELVVHFRSSNGISRMA